MKGILVVRKYKNRRLYDTERSTHITRDQLLEVIREGRKVQVQEAGTGEDVTVETLMQLILSEDGLAASFLTPDFLHFLIRTDASLLAPFFRDTMPMVMRAFQQGMSGFPQGNPWGAFGAFPGFPGFGGGFSPSPQAPPSPPPPERGGAEVDAMREELDQMRAELARMREDGGAALRKKRAAKKKAKKKPSR